MMAKLHRRLAALFLLFTGLVLASALAVTYQLAAAQYKAGQQALLQTALSSLTARLAEGHITDGFLAQLEAQGPYLIFIDDNGQPLAYPGSWQPATPRSQLFATAQEAAAAAGLTLGQQAELSITGQAGDAYQGPCLVLKSTTGTHRLFLLRSLTRQQQALAALLGQYLLLGMACLVVLALASWLLTRLALRPTQEALRRQKEFVAAAGHELRSPLAVIKTSVQAALQSPMQAPPLLAAAEREADRLRLLVTDLLELSQADGGGWAIQKAPLDLDTFCIRLWEQFGPVAAQSGHTFVLELPEASLPPLCTDEARLVQLLTIFIDNALTHTPAGTRVALQARAQPGQISFLVADNGPGLPTGESSRIFERFYRGDASRTDKRHFGLGLSVARELAQALGAALTAENAPNGGAVFCLTFPV